MLTDALHWVLGFFGGDSAAGRGIVPTRERGRASMTAKAMPGRALAAPGRNVSGLSRLSASGIYQFRGSGGEKITIINKEKLRTSTAGVSNKGKK